MLADGDLISLSATCPGRRLVCWTLLEPCTEFFFLLRRLAQVWKKNRLGFFFPLRFALRFDDLAFVPLDESSGFFFLPFVVFMLRASIFGSCDCDLPPLEVAGSKSAVVIVEAAGASQAILTGPSVGGSSILSHCPTDKMG